MILILFAVFFILWAISLFPWSGSVTPWRAGFAWICVGLLALAVFHGGHL